jgi:hypothetical protein
MVLAVNGADQPLNEKQPDPRNELKTIAQARQKIASGEIEFDMFTYFSDRPLDGTNHVRLKVVFDGEKRRFEQFGREYSYVLMGPTPVPSPMPKGRNWAWTRKQPCRRDSLPDLNPTMSPPMTGSVS